ncbi:carboxylesterase/lipase family protein [Amorphoplanes digitatis]|uniref:Carboxylic ester hydrolase n=1 Tax=Actinoplanes digitatis TaxID=1868 RepID=A0A7W7MQ55_9ACTN|nr:carboxylesterase family protein [Actinoplanes digitatis]MBB4762846.1 para-nitrobenzyl esterase [Actinoplanes digitatis]GID91659.1 carboxylic ester hydrolase [Actinoplanes digitatis]
MRPVSALIGATLAAVLAVPGAAVAHGGGGPVVNTDKGLVQGVRAGGVDSFLGVRYASPPVGGLRWRAPLPATAWPGVAPAIAYGARCAAAAGSNGPRSEAEDCLFVNVQRPAGLRARERRPVYVFIHGGGLVNGSSNQADMAAMVRATGVIGVSFNYRLGVLGFLGLAGLTAESGESGNYGFQDQQAALAWVRRNIAAFGGDPARVTVGGESAGGWSVCGHLVAPGSRGLLAGAMIQSGSCLTRTQPAAESAGAAVATAVGCTNVACLRATPVARLIDAPSGGFALVRGTPTLPADPAQAVAAGDFARVPVVIGANLDEGRTFAQGFIGATREQYEAWVQANGGAEVLARYPWPANPDRFTAAYLIGAIMTDSGMLAGIGGCANRALTHDFARWTTTYAYEFAHRTGPGLTPIPGYVWGAGHAAELAYLFPSFDNGTPIAPTFDRDERRLAAEMKRAWGAFVRTGSPGWPPRGVQSLRAGGESRLIGDAALAAEHQCAFWDAR